jgi:hypothetical protein
MRGLSAICKIIADSRQIPGQAREYGTSVFGLVFFCCTAQIVIQKACRPKAGNLWDACSNVFLCHKVPNGASHAFGR